ncbi:MAG: hypothetical protein AB7O80_16985 [Acetobacteraceae bacterium]
MKVSPLPAAIATATSKWMGWTISRATARETGVPQGLPYLTGFVVQAAIKADAADLTDLPLATALPGFRRAGLGLVAAAR